MKYVSLYESTPRLSFQEEDALDRASLPVLREGSAGAGDSRGCTRCAFGDAARTVCLGAAGEPGGVYVLGEYPTEAEDRRGVPFVGKSGAWVRAQISARWDGPVVYDYAVRCAPGKREVKPTHVKACRGYLTATIEEVRPKMIFALGSVAYRALTGNGIASQKARGICRWFYPSWQREPIPIYLLPNATLATRNRFVARWLTDGLDRAFDGQTPQEVPLDGLVNVVETVEDAKLAIREVSAAPWAAWDVEAAGRMFSRSYRLLSVAIAAKGSDDSYVWDRDALANPEVVAELKRWFESSSPKVGANVKYDLSAVRFALGVLCRGTAGDVRLWRKLLDDGASGKLEHMADLVGMGAMKEEAEAVTKDFVTQIKVGVRTEALLRRRALEPDKKWPKLSAANEAGLQALRELQERDPALAAYVRTDVEVDSWRYAVTPPAVLARYNGRDAVATARVGALLEPQFTDPGLDRIRRTIVDKAASRIARVEEWGIRAEEEPMRVFDSALALGQHEAQERLDKHAPGLNPGSWEQVCDFLYKKLKVRVTKTTKSGNPSTDKTVLDKLSKRYPAALAIKDWRHYAHLRSTYGVALLQHVRDDGRIHPSILVDGAGTGRTSMQEPNLQNQPSEKRDAYLGKLARDCFVAAPGRKLVSLDYSQIELRVAAMVSGDEVMTEIFRSGVDFHLRTAQLIAHIWGLKPDQVGKQHRSIAKNINFAALYNAGVAKIAEMATTPEYKCSLEEAARAQDAILGKFKRFASWRDASIRSARKTGSARTWWDGEPARVRSLHQIGDPDDYVRSNAENAGCNTPIQGTASDFLIASLCEGVDWVEDDGLDPDVMLVLPVHDQLVWDVADDYVDEVVHVSREIMCSWPSAGVPLVVDAEVGQAWGSLEPWKQAA